MCFLEVLRSASHGCFVDVFPGVASWKFFLDACVPALLINNMTNYNKKFREKRVDWAELFPDLGFSSDDNMDITELLPLNIGKVYRKMEATNHGETTSKYGLIPLMEISSTF